MWHVNFYSNELNSFDVVTSLRAYPCQQPNPNFSLRLKIYKIAEKPLIPLSKQRWSSYCGATVWCVCYAMSCVLCSFRRLVHAVRFAVRICGIPNWCGPPWGKMCVVSHVLSYFYQQQQHWLWMWPPLHPAAIASFHALGSPSHCAAEHCCQQKPGKSFMYTCFYVLQGWSFTNLCGFRRHCMRL